MTVDRDFERLLDTWLADGPITAPDRIIDSVADRIDRQHQRPAWRLSWRDFHVVTTSKMAAVLTAVLVVSVIGIALVLRPGGSNVVSPGSTTSPAPTATPMLTPTPSASPTGEPTPGTSTGQVQGTSLWFDYRAPTGWTCCGWAITKTNSGFGGPNGIGIGASGAVNVPTDPCDGIGKVSDATTAEDVVADLQRRPDLVVSNVVSTTLGGLSGKRLDVHLPADLSACTDLYILFAEPDGSGVFAQGPSNVFSLWILESDVGPIWVDIEHFAGTPAADLAEARAIVSSMVFRH